MINNKQVSIWRGDKEPPTIYHVWIYSDQTIKLHNGTEWVTFVDSFTVVDAINKILDRLESLEGITINEYSILDNPILDGEDLKVSKQGAYINPADKVSDAIIKLDKLLRTEVLE